MANLAFYHLDDDDHSDSRDGESISESQYYQMRYTHTPKIVTQFESR